MSAQNNKEMIGAAVEAMRADITALVVAKTAEWGTAEGMLPRELTPQTARETRMGELVHEISKGAGSSIKHAALHQLVETIVGRPIPKAGVFASMPVGGAILSSERLFVVTKPSPGPNDNAFLVQVDTGESNSLAWASKSSVTIPEAEEITRRIASAPAQAIFTIYDAFNAAATSAK